MALKPLDRGLDPIFSAGAPYPPASRRYIAGQKTPSTPNQTHVQKWSEIYASVAPTTSSPRLHYGDFRPAILDRVPHNQKTATTNKDR